MLLSSEKFFGVFRLPSASFETFFGGSIRRRLLSSILAFCWGLLLWRPFSIPSSFLVWGSLLLTTRQQEDLKGKNPCKKIKLSRSVHQIDLINQEAKEQLEQLVTEVSEIAKRRIRNLVMIGMWTCNPAFTLLYHTLAYLKIRRLASSYASFFFKPSSRDYRIISVSDRIFRVYWVFLPVLKYVCRCACSSLTRGLQPKKNRLQHSLACAKGCMRTLWNLRISMQGNLGQPRFLQRKWVLCGKLIIIASPICQ